MENLMQKPSVSILAIMKQAWHLVKGTKKPAFCTYFPGFLVSLAVMVIVAILFVLVAVMNFGLYGVTQGITQFEEFVSDPVVAFGFMVVWAVLQSIMVSGFTAGQNMIGLKRARNETLSNTAGLHYFEYPKIPVVYFIQSLIAIIVFQLMAFLPDNHAWIHIVGDFIGLALNSLFCFSLLFAIDQNQTALKAISSSAKLAAKHFLKVFGLNLIIFALMIIGMVPLFIGLIWVLPFNFICIGILYQRLTA
jgi:uncharacterized membrane protein